MNPHDDPKKLGLVLLSFYDPNLYYEFDILCFWATPDKKVYTASDGGCSCPHPFEDFEGETYDEVIQKLERVKDLDHAINCFKAWNKKYDDDHKVSTTEVDRLITWYARHA